MVQEIDGQALMLLQADHLMSAMSIKLGPALKICEQVDICLNFFLEQIILFSALTWTKMVPIAGEPVEERSCQELTTGGSWKGGEEGPGEKPEAGSRANRCPRATKQWAPRPTAA